MLRDDPQSGHFCAFFAIITVFFALLFAYRSGTLRLKQPKEQR